MNSIGRVVCWWSAGATSAVATKIAIDKYRKTNPIDVVYCDTGGEHSDNNRFLKDCEDWYSQKITVLKSNKYSDIWDVFKKTRYLAGVKGARCTTEMKKNVRRDYERHDDLQVFGFDKGEIKRADRFKENNIEVNLYAPLIERGISKQDCLKTLEDHKIDIPAMYKLGYKNNNCIGCVKGGMGYWNKIRVDFPDVFQRMLDIEQELGVALCKSYKGDGVRKKVFLKDLDPTAGRYESELGRMTCGLLCE